MTPADWLRTKLPGAPETLLETMIEVLPEDSETVSDALARAAMTLYARVVGLDGGRDAAVPLLAADALLTHAFQAKAEEDPEGLDEFAAHWGRAASSAGWPRRSRREPVRPNRPVTPGRPDRGP